MELYCLPLFDVFHWPAAAWECIAAGRANGRAHPVPTRSFGPTSLLARSAIAVTPPPWFLWLPLADFPQRSFAGGAMEALRKFVLRQNVVGMTTPPVLRGAQSLVGMTGASDVTAAARWGAVLGLTAFWFIGALRVEATRGVRRGGEHPWSEFGSTMSGCHCRLSAALFGCLTVCSLCGDCCCVFAGLRDSA